MTLSYRICNLYTIYIYCLLGYKKLSEKYWFDLLDPDHVANLNIIFFALADTSKRTVMDNKFVTTKHLNICFGTWQ